MYCSQYQETTRKEQCHRTVQQTTYQYEESTGGLEGERCIKLAISPTHCRAWLCSTQGRFQRRSMPKVWMATTTLPANCVCGKHLTIEHALSCPCGGFPSIRHNELRDLTAQFLTETCRNVGIEPTLQPLGDEHLRHRTAIREDGARLDIVAENFWGRDRQNAFFDVRVFNPYAQSHRSSTLAQCYRRNEQEKKRSYEERVREVEHGSFSPLIFSTSGGLGPIATVVYKRIASLIAEKRDQPYSRTLFWLRCKLSFSLLRSAIMCIRGSRSSYHHPSRTSGEAIDLICSESRIA